MGDMLVIKENVAQKQMAMVLERMEVVIDGIMNFQVGIQELWMESCY